MTEGQKRRAKRNSQVVALYTDDLVTLTVKQIGEKFRLSDKRVYGIIKQECPGLAAGARRRRASRDRLIVSLYTEDLLTYREIGEKVGITRQGVEQVIRRKCPDLAPHEVQKKRTLPRIKYILSQTHKTNKELGIELGMGMSQVAKIRYGTKYNSRQQETKEERFWRYVKKTKSCWIWLSCMSGSNKTQSRFQKGNKHYSANRFAWELLRGKIPPQKYLLHTCKNYACVNPDHMQIVSNRREQIITPQQEKLFQGAAKRFLKEQNAPTP